MTNHAETTTTWPLALTVPAVLATCVALWAALAMLFAMVPE
jgi:hypothetical protein